MLQRSAFLVEAQLYGDPTILPLRDEVGDVLAAVRDPATTLLVAGLVADGEHGREGRLVASARVRVHDEPGTSGTRRVGHVGRVVVAHDLQRRGLGSLLLRAVHDAAEVDEHRLVTGGSSEGNLRLYERHGYAVVDHQLDDRGVRLAVMSASRGASAARA